MTSTNTPRQPHAILDLPSRIKKGQKIESLLDLTPSAEPIHLLEIGTGSGGIAHYFANHPFLRCKVMAVDVIDQRQVTQGYDFTLVKDTTLPVGDASFDVVLSNHVIEHVGDAHAQRHHISELRRVLKKNGIGYLAVPNRWMLVEPHYHLAFLSWLPTPWRTPYLRLMGRGEVYDCNPPSKNDLEVLLRKGGLEFEFLSTRALRELLRLEGAGLVAKVAGKLPDSLLGQFASINPTLIYRLTHANNY